MIIKCEQCNTKFKLDDSKVTEKGVKVRCAKCKHVFTVKKEVPEAPDYSSMLDSQHSPFGFEDEVAPTVSQTAIPNPEAPTMPLPTPPAVPPEPSFDAFAPSFEENGQFSQEEQAERTVRMDAISFVKAVEPSPPAASPPYAPSETDFSLSDLEGDKGFSLDAPATPDAGMDFSSFDFGDTSAEADRTVLASTPVTPLDLGDKTMLQHSSPLPPPAEPVQDPGFGGLDFSGDNLFGDAVAPQVPEEPSTPIKFDFAMDDFADSMGVETSTVQKSGTAAPALEVKSDEPFSMGEIDFGDELSSVAVQQVNPDELKPNQDLLFAPIAEAKKQDLQEPGEDTLKKMPGTENSAIMTENTGELPPLSIAGRRKQSSMMTGLAAGLAVLVALVLGYFAYSSLSGDKANPAQEAGSIAVRAIDAYYLKSSASGSDLFVITGEAVNNFKKPRAAIQIKGVILGAKGQILVSKTAYCGNPLPKEQLADMPLDKIEAAMANQFGDSLANLEVATGKTVPFVIVIPNPPADAKDYEVVPAGSTMATGKQP